MRCATRLWSPIGIVALSMSTFGSLGCAHDESPPPAAVNPDPPAAVTEDHAEPQQAPVAVSEPIKQKCQIPDTPSQSPQFDFDQADLRSRGEDILSRVAECMQNGALKGQSLTLIGHADPRGSKHYNRALGMERARAARTHLESQGVARSSLRVKSRGELDATGSDAASWQLDRRVDIEETSAL